MTKIELARLAHKRRGWRGASRHIADPVVYRSVGFRSAELLIQAHGQLRREDDRIRNSEGFARLSRLLPDVIVSKLGLVNQPNTGYAYRVSLLHTAPS